LSAAARLFTEAFHGDSLVTLGGFRVVQIAALLLLAASLWLSRRWSATEPPAGRRTTRASAG
ncbi:MAG TPA: hypothetical protein VLL49_04780, partial [Anaerolineales bacterium]|nr:hypothetical protein [Anaerolineales bacterium]